MSDETGSPGGSAVDSPRDTGGDLSIMDAVRLTVDERNKEQPAESAGPRNSEPDTATADPEVAQANADPVEEPDPGEATEEAEPAGEPPIEPPRSWTKAEKERFQSLPRETQEYLHTREQEREREFRRGQNEIADQRKAVQAEREAAEKVRQQYEAKLPALEKKLQTVGPFADIQNHEDLRKLQRDDPFRFQEYQLYVWEQQAEQADLQAAESRKAQERQGKRSAYEAEQNKLLVELVPEMADPKKAGELRSAAVAMLVDDLGLKNDQLTRWMADDTGHEILSNAGIQKLIADGLKYRDIQKAPKAVAAKPVPPVQRPGTAKPTGSANSGTLQALQERFNRTGSLKDAQALHAAEFSQKRRA